MPTLLAIVGDVAHPAWPGLLVCATALTIEPAALGRLAAAWPSLLAALAAGMLIGSTVRQARRWPSAWAIQHHNARYGAARKDHTDP